METGDPASIPNVTDSVAKLNPIHFAARDEWTCSVQTVAVSDGSFKVHEAAVNGGGVRHRRVF